MPTLTVTLGVPGSGKSTWVTTHTEGALILSADILRSDQALGRKALTTRMERDALIALRRGSDVIVDVCGIIAAQRAAWLSVARWSGASTRLVVMTTPHAVSIERNAARPDAVPDAFMARYIHDHAAAMAMVTRERWDRIVQA